MYKISEMQALTKKLSVETIMKDDFTHEEIIEMRDSLVWAVGHIKLLRDRKKRLVDTLDDAYTTIQMI